MKKVLSIALALALGLSSFAQQNVAKRANGFKSPVPGKVSVAPIAKQQGAKDLPNWQPIGSTWTATDINGNTVNIADTMAAGKSLVIDYSATWCSWCWVVHQAGLLEAIYNQLGDDVCVLWIEADASTSTQSIYGGSGSMGDWTNGGTVPYPIIDDASTTSLINNNVAGFPTIVFVSANGYWCDLYGASWGFGPYDSGSQAVSAVSNLISNAPAAGEAPMIAINGPTSTPVGVAAAYEASIISVDQVTAINWTIDGGTPSTSTDNPISVTWDAAGTYTITLSVTNTTGTTTTTMDVTTLDWSDWGDTMSYCGNAEMASAVGAGGDITWGINIPAAFMSGREYLSNVQLYVYGAGDYDLTIYQGGTDAPQSLIYDHSYTITETGWVTFPLYDIIELDDTKSLWVAFHNEGVSYPASYVEFVGDYNGSLVCWDDEWLPVQELSASLNSTWMIKAITSSSTPNLNIDINAPESIQAGDNVTFSAAGPSSATYSWTFQGANTASATGATVTTSWANPGNYTVTLNASYQGATATATTSVTVTAPLAVIFDFENTSAYNNWTYIDDDGDGHGWTIASSRGHNSNQCMMSESYDNNSGPLTPDNWVFTPAITLSNDDNNMLSWWAQSQDAGYPDEKYAVYVCAAPTVASANSSNRVYEGISTGTWTQNTASLDNFKGQTVYIGFRHYDCTDMFQLNIDDVAIYGNANVGITNAANVNVALYPNPTNSMLNIATEGLQSVEVMDMTGRMVMTSSQNTIDMSQLSNGVYVVRVNTLNGTAIQKVVKK